MITEDYVSFETAKLLKEKGFDVPCYGYYYTSKYMTYGDIKQRNLELFPDSYSAPTLQMAVKWILEFHNIYIDPYPEKVNTWCLIIWKLSRKSVVMIKGSYDNYSYKTYKEACEAAIKYCLENLI